ncbi:ATP-binding protein [Nonomuraea sediminis]|uniref:ATP-binding protein n=1 Tax=Nonomuraea sediminis TaxID=2835864 RepID=UPI001BDCC64A|nr:tetratricopeptide repeat protein [Nonomuraea sediminis]
MATRKSPWVWISLTVGGLMAGALGVIFIVLDLKQADQLASVFVALAGLGISVYGVVLARRSETPNPISSPTTTSPPAGDTIKARGKRSVAVRDNSGVIQTGDTAHSTTGAGDTHNTIEGSTFQGSVTMGRDITMHVAGPAPRALEGLPAAPIGFVGRAETLRNVLAFLDPTGEGEPGVVVSAVAGMAGIGKTALALMAAHQAMRKGWFSGGVFFMSLHGYDPNPAGRVSAAAAAGQLLRAMGTRDTDLPPTDEELLGLYRSVLAERARQRLPVLVVADNAAVTGQVEPLLPAQPCHRLLVTSRHTLTLRAHLIDLAILSEAEALDLLRTALQVGGADRRVEAEPEQAAAIVGLCGHLPLALQIIAALLRAEPSRSLVDMAAELADARQRLNVLESGDFDAHGRPVAVRAAFDLSYHHLLAAEPEQARLFRLLPLNPGPDLSLDAAAALTGTPELQVRRQLAALARAHLLTSPNGDRWGMHDLLRLYADEHGHVQAAVDDRGQALDRLLNFYVFIAGVYQSDLRDGSFNERENALAWFDAERANLVAAVVLAQSADRHLIASELPACLNTYLSWRRALNDLVTVNTIALTASTRLGDRNAEARALTSLGNALRGARRFDEAIAAHQNAAAIFRELGDRGGEPGDRGGEGAALNNLGIVLREVGRFDEAIAAHQNAAAIFRDLGDRGGESIAQNNFGIVLCQVGRFDEAIAAHQNAAAIFRDLGDVHSEGLALGSLAGALREVGRFDEAIAGHQNAAAIFRDLGDRGGEGLALGSLAGALREVGRFDEAIAAHQNAAAIYRDLGDRHREGMALNNLGVVLLQVRRFEEAITAFEQATGIFESLADEHSRDFAQANLEEVLRLHSDG